MICPHLSIIKRDKGICVLEYLFISKHPISEKKVNYDSPFAKFDSIFCYFIVKHWRKLIEVCYLKSFYSVQHKVCEGSYRKQDRHSKTIHHSYKENINHPWVLVVNEVFWATIQIYIKLQRCFLSFIWIVCFISIFSPQIPFHGVKNNEINKR